MALCRHVCTAPPLAERYRHPDRGTQPPSHNLRNLLLRLSGSGDLQTASSYRVGYPRVPSGTAAGPRSLWTAAAAGRPRRTGGEGER